MMVGQIINDIKTMVGRMVGYFIVMVWQMVLLE